MDFTDEDLRVISVTSQDTRAKLLRVRKDVPFIRSLLESHENTLSKVQSQHLQALIGLLQRDNVSMIKLNKIEGIVNKLKKRFSPRISDVIEISDEDSDELPSCSPTPAASPGIPKSPDDGLTPGGVLAAIQGSGIKEIEMLSNASAPFTRRTADSPKDTDSLADPLFSRRLPSASPAADEPDFMHRSTTPLVLEACKDGDQPSPEKDTYSISSTSTSSPSETLEEARKKLATLRVGSAAAATGQDQPAMVLASNMNDPRGKKHTLITALPKHKDNSSKDVVNVTPPPMVRILSPIPPAPSMKPNSSSWFTYANIPVVNVNKTSSVSSSNRSNSLSQGYHSSMSSRSYGQDSGSDPRRSFNGNQESRDPRKSRDPWLGNLNHPRDPRIGRNQSSHGPQHQHQSDPPPYSADSCRGAGTYTNNIDETNHWQATNNMNNGKGNVNGTGNPNKYTNPNWGVNPNANPNNIPVSSFNGSASFRGGFRGGSHNPTMGRYGNGYASSAAGQPTNHVPRTYREHKEAKARAADAAAKAKLAEELRLLEAEKQPLLEAVEKESQLDKEKEDAAAVATSPKGTAEPQMDTLYRNSTGASVKKIDFRIPKKTPTVTTSPSSVNGERDADAGSSTGSPAPGKSCDPEKDSNNNSNKTDVKNKNVRDLEIPNVHSQLLLQNSENSAKTLDIDDNAAAVMDLFTDKHDDTEVTAPPVQELRRIQMRRYSMVPTASVPLVDKSEILTSGSLLYEDLQEHKRQLQRARQLAHIYEKTSDNCRVSTQNIITGKRRTRCASEVSFNKTQQSRRSFGLGKINRRRRSTMTPAKAKVQLKEATQAKAPGAADVSLSEASTSSKASTRKRRRSVSVASVVSNQPEDQPEPQPQPVPPPTARPRHKSRPKRNELEMLNDDIAMMYYGADVLKATGRRACTQRSAPRSPSLETNSSSSSSSSSSRMTSPIIIRNVARRGKRLRGPSSVNVGLNRASFQTRGCLVQLERHPSLDKMAKKREEKKEEEEKPSQEKKTGRSAPKRRTLSLEKTMEDVRNVNPEWHATSAVTITCVICNVNIRNNPLQHYIKNHGEHYGARMPPGMLNELRAGRNQRPDYSIVRGATHVFYYKCPFCVKVISINAKKLTEHLLSHTGERRYQCSHCLSSQHRFYVMQDHIKTCAPGATILEYENCGLLPISLYVCHLCEFVQVSRDHMNQHLVKQHGLKEEEVLELGLERLLLCTIEGVPKVMSLVEGQKIVESNLKNGITGTAASSTKAKSKAVASKVSKKTNKNSKNKMNRDDDEERPSTSKAAQKKAANKNKVKIRFKNMAKKSLRREMREKEDEGKDQEQEYKPQVDQVLVSQVNTEAVLTTIEGLPMPPAEQDNLLVVNECLMDQDMDMELAELVDGEQALQNKDRSILIEENTLMKMYMEVDDNENVDVDVKNEDDEALEESVHPEPEKPTPSTLQDLTLSELDADLLEGIGIDASDLGNNDTNIDETMTDKWIDRETAESEPSPAAPATTVPQTSPLKRVENVAYRKGGVSGMDDFYCIYPGCTFLFPNELGLEDHFAQEHSTVRWTGTCGLCPRSRKNPDSQSHSIADEVRHMREGHMKTKPNVELMEVDSPAPEAELEPEPAPVATPVFTLRVRRFTGDRLTEPQPEEESQPAAAAATMEDQSNDILLGLLQAEPRPPNVAGLGKLLCAKPTAPAQEQPVVTSNGINNTNNQPKVITYASGLGLAISQVFNGAFVPMPVVNSPSLASSVTAPASVPPLAPLSVPVSGESHIGVETPSVSQHFRDMLNRSLAGQNSTTVAPSTGIVGAEAGGSAASGLPEVSLATAVTELLLPTGYSEDKLYACPQKGCIVRLTEEQFLNHVIYHIRSTLNQDSEQINCKYCDQTFLPPSLRTHLQQSHGRHKLFCSICLATAVNKRLMVYHVRKHHSQAFENIKGQLQFIQLPTDPEVGGTKAGGGGAATDAKSVFLTAVVQPFGKQEMESFKRRLLEELLLRRQGTKMAYRSSEVPLLPRVPFFSQPLRCCECNFSTKERAVILRHLTDHKKRNERKAYQMDECLTDAAPTPAPESDVDVESVEDNAVAVETIRDSIEAQVDPPAVQPPGQHKAVTPKFMYVPPDNRYRCGFVHCIHLLGTELELRKHMTMNHCNTERIFCHHCKVGLLGQSSVDKYLEHLMLHKRYIYQCGACVLYNERRSTIVRHIQNRHPVHEVDVVVHRQSDTVLNTNARWLKTPKRTSLMQMKFFCNLCQVSLPTLDQIAAHAEAVHDREYQYHCLYCCFGNKKSCVVIDHILDTHPGRRVQPIQVFQHPSSRNTLGFYCIVCLKGASTCLRIGQHCEEVHKSRYQWHCPHCEFGNQQERIVNQHIEMKHPQRLGLAVMQFERVTNEIPDALSWELGQPIEEEVVAVEEEPAASNVLEEEEPTASNVVEGETQQQKQPQQPQHQGPPYQEPPKQPPIVDPEVVDLLTSDDEREDTEPNESPQEEKMVKFACTHCSETNSNLQDLRTQHWAHVHPDQPFYFRVHPQLLCPECKRFKGDAKTLRDEHLVKVHSIQNIVACDVRRPEECAYCDYKYHSTHDLAEHISKEGHLPYDLKNLKNDDLAVFQQLSASGQKEYYQCDLCSVVRLTKDAIAVHGRVEHSRPGELFCFRQVTTPIIYHCFLCMFTSGKELITLRHMVDHHSRFLYCHFCAKHLPGGFGEYIQHCNTQHREDLHRFQDLHSYEDLRKFLRNVHYQFQNGLIITKSSLRCTRYKDEKVMRLLYAELMSNVWRPPIRLHINLKSVPASAPQVSSASGQMPATQEPPVRITQRRKTLNPDEMLRLSRLNQPRQEQPPAKVPRMANPLVSEIVAAATSVPPAVPPAVSPAVPPAVNKLRIVKRRNSYVVHTAP